jgi:hypothetical protein
MFRLRPSRSPASLGLVFEDDGLLATLARTDSAAPPPSLRLPCAIETDDPILLGRALRRALRAAGWRWDRCAVGLPTEWCLALGTKVPDLSPEDLDALLALEAERNLPSDPSEWVIGRCMAEESAGRRVLQVAISRARLTRIESLLRAAGLRPVLTTATLAAAAIALPRPALVVRRGRQSGALCLAAPSGIVTLRSVSAGDAGLVDLARDVRIARETQDVIEPETAVRLLVVSPNDETGEAAADRPALRAFGRTTAVERVSDAILPTLLLDAVRSNPAQLPSLRPPAPSHWARVLQHPGSRRLRLLALTGAAALLLFSGAFGWKEVQLFLLRREWAAIRPEVERISEIRARLREFRAWDDSSLPALSLLRLVTEAFPESGAVTARSVEVRPPQTITVTGTAREHSALLATIDRLRQQPSVRNVRVEQIRGQSPAQFTFAVELNRPASP